MLKRFSIVGILVALVLALGVSGAVLAQDPTSPSDDVCPYGGTCGGYGMGGHGMGGYGYHGTMPSLLAEALGMTLDELYAALADGQTVAELAAAQGIELADLVGVLIAPHIEHLEQAVADGYMTQEQADGMIEEMTEHMAWRLENFGLGYGGYGNGGCGMGGGGYGHRGGMRSGRWGGNTNTPRVPAWSAPSTGF